MNDPLRAGTTTNSDSGTAAGESLPTFQAASLSGLLRSVLPEPLQKRLRAHIRGSRWFRGKARTIRELEVLDQLPLRATPDEATLIIVRVSYVTDAPEVYVLPLAFAAETPATRAPAAHRRLFTLERGPAATGRGVVYDPSGGEELAHSLLELFVREQTPGERGTIKARRTEALTSRVRSTQLTARQPTGDQSNTTVFFGDEFTLKLFRQLEAGENPDVEINDFLWAHGYRHVPEPLGSLRYEGREFSATLGIAQRFVSSDGTAWDATLEIVQRSLEQALAVGPQAAADWLPSDDLLESAAQNAPQTVKPLIEPYVAFVARLGARTAELHLALSSDEGSPAFTPEPFTADDQHFMVVAVRDRVDRAYTLLQRQLSGMRDEVEPLARELLGCRDALEDKLDALGSLRVHASRIRCHGDYHLGQVLHGAGDFTILDFEGEPAQPLDIRRQKGSALYDVCGMLRSFHYAGAVARQSDRWRGYEPSALAGWCDAWYRWASARFLSAYLETARASRQPAVFLPESPQELRALLRLHMIDKCSYELSYELNNRPAWVSVPMTGLLGLARGR
jgi:maltose alpha-D-glucosyltransferase/alpha-amylase